MFFVHDGGQTSISIHALREEGDATAYVQRYIAEKFLSTPSARRATRKSPSTLTASMAFLSTPSARRATTIRLSILHYVEISIHALREEGDRSGRGNPLRYSHFYPRPPRGGRQLVKLTTGQSKSISIHALREEGDLAALTAELEENHFYPRPPRGGRPKKLSAGQGPENFYPRPPRGGRRGGLQPGRDRQGISIHALREEGDLISLSIVMAAEIFLSTPSARRATTLAFNFTDSCEISIHALREEGDQPESDQPERNPYFYPRPPRGGRHEKGKGSPYARRISIHALREEGDGKIYALIPHTAKFLSTPSARRATTVC